MVAVHVVLQFQECNIPIKPGARLSRSQLDVFTRSGRFAARKVRFQRLSLCKVQASEFGVQSLADGAEHYGKSTAGAHPPLADHRMEEGGRVKSLQITAPIPSRPFL